MDPNQTLVIRKVTPGNDVTINITELQDKGEEVLHSEGRGLAAVLWAHLPEATIWALVDQLIQFQQEMLEAQKSDPLTFNEDDEPDPAYAEYEQAKRQHANRPEANY